MSNQIETTPLEQHKAGRECLRRKSPWWWRPRRGSAPKVACLKLCFRAHTAPAVDELVLDDERSARQHFRLARLAVGRVQPLKHNDVLSVAPGWSHMTVSSGGARNVSSRSGCWRRRPSPTWTRACYG